MLPAVLSIRKLIGSNILVSGYCGECHLACQWRLLSTDVVRDASTATGNVCVHLLCIGNSSSSSPYKVIKMQGRVGRGVRVEPASRGITEEWVDPRGVGPVKEKIALVALHLSADLPPTPMTPSSREFELFERSHGPREALQKHPRSEPVASVVR